MQANISLFLIQSRGSERVSLSLALPGDLTVRGRLPRSLWKVKKPFNFIHQGSFVGRHGESAGHLRFLFCTLYKRRTQHLHLARSRKVCAATEFLSHLRGMKIHGVHPRWHSIWQRRGSLSFTQRCVLPVVHFCEPHQHSRTEILNKHCQFGQDAFKLQQWRRGNKKNGDSWFIIIAAAVFPPINLWYARVLN